MYTGTIVKGREAIRKNISSIKSRAKPSQHTSAVKPSSNPGYVYKVFPESTLIQNVDEEAWCDSFKSMNTDKSGREKTSPRLDQENDQGTRKDRGILLYRSVPEPLCKIDKWKRYL